MDDLSTRLHAAVRAVGTLEELAQLESPTPVQRDAAIQRFEYSVEATWKAARHYLLQREGVERASPKSVIRACREVGLLSDDQAGHALAMIDDRNLTAHTYNEGLARMIFARLPAHVSLLGKWLDAMDTATDA